MRPVIALLSDFGTRDHYVGTMKGVILDICPEATLVDITHEVDPHDVVGGALELAASFKYFPRGTVFLAVVDPGVGSTRRAIAADSGQYRFVGPDNGVLAMAFRDAPPNLIVELSDPRYARPTISRTFEGRDRFAPAAAWLATGIDVAALGREVAEYQRLELPRPDEDADTLSGRVLAVDRFGNLITNIDRQAFERFALLGPIEIRTGAGAAHRLVGTYAEIRNDEVCALFGSTDRLELSAHNSSAAARLSLARGAAVVLTVTRR